MAKGDRLRDRLDGFRPETRTLLVAGAAVAVATFALGFGLTALNYMRGGAPIDVVTVPDVREMVVNEASRVLERRDLSIAVGDSFPNQSAPQGTVLAQSPLPGQEVSPGTEVRVIISQGKAAPAVPDVSALPLALATQTLQASGFSVVIEDAHGEGSEGDVLGTVPGAGTSVPLPATVRLRVGAPALPVVVPVLVGMSETDARDIAASLGFVIDEVAYIPPDEGEPEQVVVGQSPPAGEEVPRGSGLFLRVRGDAPPETMSQPGFPDSDVDDLNEDASVIREGRDS